VDWRGRALRAEEAVRVAEREVSGIEDGLVMLDAMIKADDQALGDLSDAIGDLRALLRGGWVTNAATHAAIARVLDAHDRWVALDVPPAAEAADPRHGGRARPLRADPRQRTDGRGVREPTDSDLPDHFLPFG